MRGIILKSYTAPDSSNAKEEPRKFNDHGMDALRCMTMSTEQTNTKDLRQLLRSHAK